MTQNIYDDPDFFARYATLRRSIYGLDAAPEWASLQAMLPEIRGARVLDLGCGYGWFCRWVRAAGAARTVGFDVSERMVSQARITGENAAIEYALADLETVELPEAAFDLVYSSLTFHYIERLDRLLAQIRRALVPNGRLVFSVEHPLLTAPSTPRWGAVEGRRVWPVDRYLEEGARDVEWLGSRVVKQHRTFATYFRLLDQAGFAALAFEEWGPTDAQIAAQPELAPERQRPTFLLAAAAPR